MMETKRIERQIEWNSEQWKKAEIKLTNEMIFRLSDEAMETAQKNVFPSRYEIININVIKRKK